MCWKRILAMKKLLILIFVCLFPVGFLATGANKDKKSEGGTFAKPDFAFPQTVDKKAVAVLQHSLPDNPADAVKALLQIMISKNIISSDNFGASMNLWDSVALEMPTPYRQIIRSLQAEAYRDCYNSNSYNYNNRKLPLGEPWPENVQAWSRDMFVAKILQLVNESVADRKALQSVPLSRISGLLNHCTEEDMRYVPTVFDLLSWRGIYLLDNFGTNQSVIPFTTNPGQLSTPGAGAVVAVSNLYKNLEKANIGNVDAYAYVISAKADKDGYDAGKMLLTAFNMMRDKAASLLLLDALAPYAGENPAQNKGEEEDRYVISTKDYYNLCRNAVQAFPKADYVTRIKNRLLNIERKRVEVKPATNFLTTDSILVQVSSSNVNKFYLLLMKVNNPDKGNRVDVKDMIKGKVIESRRVSVEGTVPFSASQTVHFSPVGAGYYAIIPSTSTSPADAAGMLNSTSVECMRVGNFSAFSTYAVTGTADAMVYVVEAENLNPVSGATVKHYGNYYRTRDKLLATTITDKEGSCKLGENGTRLVIGKGGEEFEYFTYVNNYRQHKNQSNYIKLLTDLSLYHPGDTIGFAAIAYRYTDAGYSLLCEHELSTVLYDVNGNKIDSVKISTDEYGRAEGRLLIPQSGVLGNFTIRSIDITKEGVSEQESRTNPAEGIATVMVAEYKAPTFFVQLDSIAPEYTPGTEVTIKGSVTTYSGMPVGGASVKLTVDYNPLWRLWWGNGADATYGVEATADAQGRFSFSLPTANLKGTRFENGLFTVAVTATSPAGESRESESEFFCLGNRLRMAASAPSQINASEKVLKVSAVVTNAAGKPQLLPVIYKIIDTSTGRQAGTGTFVSPDLQLPLKDLPSGRYVISFTLESDTSVKASVTTIVYRDNDKTPPFATSLWLPRTLITAPDGASTVKVPVGSSYKGAALFCQVSSDTALISRRWIYPDGKNETVTVPVPGDNSRIFVTFTACHDFTFSTGQVEIQPASATQKLDVEVTTFRDKITPGKSEVWTFRFRDTLKSNPGNIPALAVMTDKALNAIYDFGWYFSPNRSYSSPVNTNYYSLPVPTWSYSSMVKNYKDLFRFSLPDVYTYGYDLYPHHLYIRGTRRAYAAGANIMFAESATEDGAVSDYAEAESAAAPTAQSCKKESKESSAVTGSALEEQTQSWRKNEYPLAFFKPMLTSDESGNLDISFTVPDFNTTWQFQLMGYDKELRTASAKLYSVASKPVMVQSLVPRFLRTSDKVQLRATLFNNTDQEQLMSGLIELFNPMNGALLGYYHTDGITVAPKSSVVISYDFVTPCNEQTLGIRARATADGFTDGEQTLICILPASSPVFEAKDFYLAPKQSEYSMTLPDYDSTANITLQYCDNPVWYCVTALPEISTPESDNLLSLLYACYGNALASGLTSRYPRIRTAIQLWQGSEMLESPLQRNSQLKSLALDNTIWVRNADAETLRMSKLDELLNADACNAAMNTLIDKIALLQSDEGGWQWTAGMEPSLYLTSRVLLYMGQLKQMNCLPRSDKMSPMIARALKFTDQEVLEEYNRILKNKLAFPTQYMLSYFYIRSFYGEVTMTARMKSLRDKTMRYVAKEWRGLDVYNAATAAMTLHRYGDTKTPAFILESLRQKASSSPEKGIWFDNLRATWSSFNTLITTAQVLEAFTEIRPQATEIDGIRQWLILQRQAQNWGENRNIAEVIYAILSSGTDWTQPSMPAVVKLGDKVITPTPVQQLTGEYTVSLNPAEAAGAILSVKKDGEHPAWGGVMNQFIQPMSEVKEASVPDLSISKKVYIINTGANGEQASETTSLKVGDKVRVTLTVTCGRDMEYVAITDELPACFEPVEQIPGCIWQDGVMYYREPRNSQTNLFVSFLGKGVHIISYDCYVQQTGDFAIGIATAQSQYAPLLVGHSAGATLSVAP